ncbi:hypothetical protein CRYUN_Cryun15aG0059600 [Craigia yunnanensis]
MWNRLSRTEKEQSDLITEKEWVKDLVNVGKHYLLGKILQCKVVNMEAMKNVFQKIWKLSLELHIKEVGDKLFVFLFYDK